MQKSSLNNVIVLKDIASNIVEEAIVFLKPNINIKNTEFISGKKDIKKENRKEYIILEEAEKIIKNHINQEENKKDSNYQIKLEKKYNILKKINIFLIIINLICILKIF